MKNALLSLFLTVALACHREGTSITPTAVDPLFTAAPCDARQNYAKATNEAAQKLIGTWKLTGIQGYFPTPPPIPDQSVAFASDGTCTTTQGGKAYGPFRYQVGTIQNFVGLGLAFPALTVTDTLKTPTTYGSIGGPVVMLVCDNQLILDYGTPVDAPAYTYRKVK